MGKVDPVRRGLLPEGVFPVSQIPALTVFCIAGKSGLYIKLPLSSTERDLLGFGKEGDETVCRIRYRNEKTIVCAHVPDLPFNPVGIPVHELPSLLSDFLRPREKEGRMRMEDYEIRAESIKKESLRVYRIDDWIHKNPKKKRERP